MLWTAPLDNRWSRRTWEILCYWVLAFFDHSKSLTNGATAISAAHRPLSFPLGLCLLTMSSAATLDLFSSPFIPLSQPSSSSVLRAFPVVHDSSWISVLSHWVLLVLLVSAQISHTEGILLCHRDYVQSPCYRFPEHNMSLWMEIALLITYIYMHDYLLSVFSLYLKPMFPILYTGSRHRIGI